jgi:rhodanese-related sulfurtransferase
VSFTLASHELLPEVAHMSGTAAVDRALAAARLRIGPRVGVEDLRAALTDGALVVDTRPFELRRRDGEMPGAVVIERNVLEWRLDPTCPHRLEGMDDPARRVILVCDEGYASSLAAAALRDLGLTNVTDLAGGYQAWRSFVVGTSASEPVEE